MRSDAEGAKKPAMADPPRPRRAGAREMLVRLTGGLWETLLGGAAALFLMFLIWLGSNGLDNFDSALIGYAAGIVSLAFAVVTRYSRWLRMPATRRYWRRGWQLVTNASAFRALPGLLPRAVFGQLLGQGFIRRRGVWRWIGHQCLFWGVIGATLITFPLVFGWLAFKLAPGTEQIYTMHAFGIPTISFDALSFFGWSMFHALDYTAVLVTAGCVIFIVRRLRDRGAMSGQRFGYDFMPLVALLVISITGVLLTISSMFYEAAYYDALVIIHMAAVVLSLVFIPYGKFFHVLQRPASVGIQMYTETNARVAPQPCTRCGEALASSVFVNDLRETLLELGQDYSLPAHTQVPYGGATHLGELCPRCKREVRGAAYFVTNGARISQ